MNWLKRLFRKPGYWVCHYKVIPVGSDRVIQSGTFAALGKDYDVAMQDAETTVRNWVQYSFDTDVCIELYRPSWLDRLRK